MPAFSTAKERDAREIRAFPPDRLGDRQLVESAARGDRDAVAAVWDRYADLVRAVLFGALGPDVALDDLVQEVFIAFLRNAKNIADGSRLKGYLASVAVRLAAQELRRRRVRSWVGLTPTGELPDVPSAPTDGEHRQVLAALHRVLDRIGHRRRMAFMLRHVHGFGMLETAEALGVSESTLRRELARAHDKLVAGARGEPALAEFLARSRREA